MKHQLHCFLRISKLQNQKRPIGSILGHQKVWLGGRACERMRHCREGAICNQYDVLSQLPSLLYLLPFLWYAESCTHKLFIMPGAAGAGDSGACAEEPVPDEAEAAASHLPGGPGGGAGHGCSAHGRTLSCLALSHTLGVPRY